MIGAMVSAAAVLLVVAGASKLRAPAPAAAALAASLRRPRPPAQLGPAVRLSGAVETAAGVAVLVFGGPLAALALAACYLALAAVALRLARVRPGRPCGCFGSADSPAGYQHVVLDVVCVVVAVAAAARPGWPSAAHLLARTSLVHTVTIGQIALLAWLGYLSITALPALAAARRRVGDPR